MVTFLTILCIFLAAATWLLIKEVRGINLRLKNAEERTVRTEGDLLIFTQRVTALELAEDLKSLPDES